MTRVAPKTRGGAPVPLQLGVVGIAWFRDDVFIGTREQQYGSRPLFGTVMRVGGGSRFRSARLLVAILKISTPPVYGDEST